MKAVLWTKYGSPDVLQLKEVEKPVPSDNELLIKVHATTVNRTDCATIRAKPFFMRLVTGLFKPKKQIPGTLFHSTKKSVAAFLRGFVEGDGSIYACRYRKRDTKEKSIEIVFISSSQKLLKEIQIILLRFGMDSFLRFERLFQ